MPAALDCHPVEVKERALAVTPDGRCVIVAVRDIPEQIGLVPGISPLPQTAGSNRVFAAPLLDGRVPDGQQVTVWAPGNSRTVVVLRE